MFVVVGGPYIVLGCETRRERVTRIGAGVSMW